MVILKKLFFKIIKKYLRLFISMVIIASLGIGSIVGLFSVHSNLSMGVDDYVMEYGYQDILIDIEETNIDYSRLNNIDNVNLIEERIALDVSVLLGNNIRTARLFSYKDNSFKKFYVREEFNGSGIGIPIYMDYDLAKGNNVKLGDIIFVSFRDLVITCYLDKIVSGPECISIKQNKYFYGESSDFGYIYVNLDIIDSYLTEIGYSGYYNELQIVTDKSRANYLIYEDILESMGNDFKVIDYTLFEDSLVKCSIDMNIPTIYSITKIVPPVFFLIVMLVLFLFMYQILNQEKKNIGIFKAMGFKNKEILPLFLAIGVFVSIISTILGLIIAQSLNIFVMNIYFKSFQMPKFTLHLRFDIAIIISFINLLVCLLAAFLSSYPIFKIEPSSAMMIQGSDIRDPKTIKKFKLPLSVKLSISIVIRNLKRFIFSSLCISSAIIMSLCALLLNHSGDVTINQTYNQRFNFDCLVYYTNKLDQSVIDEYNNSNIVTKYEVMSYYLDDYDKENKFVIVGLDDYDMMRVVGLDGKSLIECKDGIILSKRVSDLLGKNVGDYINIGNTNLVIDDISRQYASSVCYMKKSKMEEINLNTIDVILANVKDKDSMNAFVSKTKDYLSVEYVENLYLYTMSCYNNIRPIVYLVIGMALLIGSVIIYNISQINLLESSKEIAIMKSLGVRSSYINKTWLIESLFKYVLALIIGIPLGALLGFYTLANMQSRLVEYPFDLSFVIVLFTCILALIFVLFSHILSMRRIEKWNLADLCREKE